MISRSLWIVGLVLAMLGLATAPAVAAPAFEVTLERGAHEEQSITPGASSGTFRLGYEGAFTGDIAIGASSGTVQAALNALPTINAGGGSVSVVSESFGSYAVKFDGGPLARSDVAELHAVSGVTPLDGYLGKVFVRTAYESGTRRSDEQVWYTVGVRNNGDAPTDGTQVTVEVELPAGQGTSVYFGTGGTGGTGWSCSGQPPAGAQPAKAICTRSTVLAAGASYPAITVKGILGGDAPDQAVVTATATGGGATAGNRSDEFALLPARKFGILAGYSDVSDSSGEDFTQAGAHPFSGSAGIAGFTRRLGITRSPVGKVRQAVTDLPRGFVGNALAVPQLCPGTDDVLELTCPPGSAVGEINVSIVLGNDFDQTKMPIYALEPEYGTPAQFAFGERNNLNTVFTLTPRLRPEDGYAITLDATPASVFPALRRVTWGALCSFGAHISAAGQFIACKKTTDPAANPVPLITNPTRCTGDPPTLRWNIDSWETPGIFESFDSIDPMPTGCEKIDFTPEISLTPTNSQADTPTGLDVEVTMPTEGLESNTGLSQANLANVEVALPEGMSVNPSAAHGLGSCTPQQVKLKSNEPHSCPLSSQVGTVEIETPLIRETLKGHVFMASQRNNPFDEMIGLYMVFESEKDGITIKIAGKVEADPVTGRLTSTFTENPEAPFSRAVIKFNSGPRAPLVNPPRCGSYEIHSELSPWSAADPANPTQEEIVADDSVYQVTSGPNGSPCPQGDLKADFQAGLQNPIAGSRSPFVLKLSREDGTRRFTSLDLKMPKGLVAYLKGVPYCPDSVLGSLSDTELTGKAELASPACPAASQVGTVLAGAGAGPYPFYAQGRAFLAGPYKGAPLSLAVVTPAVAGPFDLGNVVVRNAIYVDPITAEVSVVSDPIPTMLHGLKLAVRDIRVNVDREGFTVAPTSCEARRVAAKVSGEGGSSLDLANRFQVGECAALGFKPRIDLRLFGGVTRAKYQAVRAIVRPRPGDANISGAVVKFPTSAFVAQEHLNNICTRVQWAAEACPKGSIYGTAEAITPLLDEPLRGSVHLRSSNNLLPDLVADLRGPERQPIKVEVAIKTDAVKGALRSTVMTAPDAPVTMFRLQTFGGKKGLISNSRNICRGNQSARATFFAHNGRRSVQTVPVRNARCGKWLKAQKKRKAAKRRAAKRAARQG